MKLLDYPSRAIATVHKGLLNKEPLYVVRKNLESIVESIQEVELSRYNRHFLVQGALDLRARHLSTAPDRLGTVLTSAKEWAAMRGVMNSVLRAVGFRNKMNKVRDQLRTGRVASDPGIFFLCSWHQKPAEDHKELQGTVFIDKFWRKTLRERGWQDWIPQVERYIKDHRVLSIQESMQEPYFLITRPHCRHYFVPVGIIETLNGGKLIERHPEAKMVHKRPLSDRARYARDKRDRLKLKKRLG